MKGQAMKHGRRRVEAPLHTLRNNQILCKIWHVHVQTVYTRPSFLATKHKTKAIYCNSIISLCTQVYRIKHSHWYLTCCYYNIVGAHVSLHVV